MSDLITAGGTQLCDPFTELPERGGSRPDSDSVSSVAKALSLLEVMSRTEGRTVGISELAAAAELPKSTTHRLLKALEGRGFIGRAGTRYRMGERFIELGSAVWRFEYDALRECSVSTLEWLFERTGGTVHLGVLVGTQVLYVEKITGRGGCAIPSRVGARMPATCTGLGKAMLAHSSDDVIEAVLRAPLPRRTASSIAQGRGLEQELARIRETGVAFDREEARAGVFCVGAAVRSAGWPIAGISVGGPARQFGTESYANLVREAAVRLTRRFETASLQAAGI
jgi:DNA-binding IclR family transcriptional regulator